MPERIQRKRTKGWRMPEGAVYVGRPTRWGNPFVIGMSYGAAGPNGEWSRSFTIRNRADATREYRRSADYGHPAIPSDLSELRGKDLVCWCPLDQPCHADVLLELANQPIACPSCARFGKVAKACPQCLGVGWVA